MRNKFYSALFFILGVLLFVYACKKKTTPAPGYLSDPYNSEMITIPLESYHDTLDSLPTSKVAYMMAGIMNDPVFGIAMSSFYAQPHLTTASLSFTNPSDYVVDSVVLYLAYQANYGPVTVPITLKVFELTSDIYIDSTYYHFSQIPVKPYLIGAVSYKPNLTDSPIVEGIKRSPLLRIPLKKSLGKKIIQHGQFSSNDDWKAFFKGICVQPDIYTYIDEDNQIFASKTLSGPIFPPPGQGFITSFNLVNTDSRIIMYYRQLSTGTQATYSFNFPVSAARFNHFKIYPNGSQAYSSLTTPVDTTAAYIQSMHGIYLNLRLKNLENLKSKNYYVNKAELILPVNNSLTGSYLLPERLTMAFVDSTGNNYQIPDFQEGLTFFDGTYHSDIQAYVFNITRYIHQKLNAGLIDDHLAVYVSGRAIQATRVVLNNEKHPVNPMQLKLYISKLKN